MTIAIPALSPEARRSVVIGTIAITLASVAASEVATLFISLAFGLNADVPAYIVSGVVPLFLAGVGSYMQLTRLEQIRAAYRELERAATTDWLTGVLNYPSFTAAASDASQRGQPGAVIVVDIDGLKSLNHRFGNVRGDDALKSVTAIIRKHVSSTDIVGRIGGDAFGIYLRIATAQHAQDVAEAIRKDVEAVNLSVTLGVATTSGPIEFAKLLHVADKQLDAAKENGRNRLAIAAAPISEARAA